jgi:hypothetical protein
VGSEYPFTDASIIYAYSRTQAIEDGVLIDVTPTAKESGIRYPVALRAAVWASVVATPRVARRRGESDEGRLWDVVWMLRHAISCSRADTVHFSVLATNDKGRKIEHRLYAKCGPGDDASPVITVMLVGED